MEYGQHEDMFVEYVNYFEGFTMSERLTWSSFVDLCMEDGIEITFCCTISDPRINRD